MQKGRLSRGISLVLVLLGFLVGCEGGGSGGSPSGRGTSAGTARVHIQVGDGTPAQGSTSALGASVTRQRVGGIPPEVAGITLFVTVNGQGIPGNPFPIKLDSGTASVEITANVEHLFVIEITNHQGDIIFRGERTVNLRAGEETDLPIRLVPREVLRVVATQRVSAATGGEVVVTDPQSAVQGLRLLVPPQALTADTTFTVVEANNPILEANKPPDEQPVLQSQVGAIVDLLQNGTAFAVLATLVFPYDPVLVQDLGFSDASLRVYRFDVVAGQWAPVAQQTVDTVNHVIRAQLTSLSFYTVGGPRPATDERPVADPQFVIVSKDTAARDIVLTGSDTGNDVLTFRIIEEPTKGRLLGTPPVVTYIPNADAAGRDTFTFVVNDGQQDSFSATVTIDVPPNAPPGFAKGPDQEVREEDGPQTVPGWATNISAGSANEASQTLTFRVTSNTNPVLFTVGPAVAADGTLTYTLAPQANGTATLTLVLQDDGGTANGGQDTSAAQTFTIRVTSVNDVPSFTKGPDQEVREGSGPQTVEGWATGISAGAANEASQTLTFRVTSNTNPGLFAGGPAVAANGALTYTPAPQANGTATLTLVLQDDGGTANGGQDTSAAQTFTIRVTPGNTQPVATPQTVSTREDTPVPIVLTGSDIETAPANLRFTLVTSPAHGTLSGTPPSVTYTPAPDYNGPDSFTFTVTDRGDPDNCGALGASCTAPLTSPPVTVALIVIPVNDAPSLASIANQGVTEGAGEQSVTLTGISPGPPTATDETLQPVTVAATSSNPNIVPHPTVTGAGATRTLRYAIAPHTFGTVTITVTARDNGGTVNGGQDTTTQTFIITIADTKPPQFTAIRVTPNLARVGTLLTITATSNEPLQNSRTFFRLESIPVLFPCNVTGLNITCTYAVSGGEPERAERIFVSGIDLAGNEGAGTGNVTFDFTPPTATITFPGSALLTYTEVIVRGTAQDANGIAAVSVNGIVATTTDGFANWVATVPLALGRQILTVSTTDIAGNVNPLAVSATVDIVDSLVNTRRGSGLSIEIPEDIAVETSGQLLVPDIALRAVLRVDPLTGTRTVVSGCTAVTTNDCLPANLRGTGPSFSSPSDVTTETSGQLLVLDGNGPTVASLRAVLRVDPLTGNRTVVSGCAVPTTTDPCPPASLRGTGPGFVFPQDIGVEASGQLLVLDSNIPAVLRVDPLTGNRTVVSGCAIATTTGPCLATDLRGTGPALVFPGGIAVETTGQLVVMDNALRAVLRVDPLTGNRTVVSGCTVLTTESCPSANLQGSGPSFADPADIAVEASGQLLVLDGNIPTVASLRAVLRVDPLTGNRTVVSGCTVLTADSCPTANLQGKGPSFIIPEGLAIEASGQLVVVDDFLDAVLRVDTISGDRAVLSVGRVVPAISNLSQALTALNTNTCLPPLNTPPFPSRFDVRFDYNDPDGDGNSSAGATVQVDFQFSSGSSDSFDGTPVSTFSGDGFTGSVRVDLCFRFASTQSVDVTVTLTDGDGNRSNSLTVNIPRPEGSN